MNPSRTYAAQVDGAKIFVIIARHEGKISNVFISSRSPVPEIQTTIKALGAILYVAIDEGTSIKRLIQHLKGIRGGQPCMNGDRLYLSIPDAIGCILEQDEAVKQ